MSQHEHVSVKNAAARLRQAAALWSLDPADASEVVLASCDALVAGLDTPSLRMLAAASIRELHGRGHQIAELLQAALEELGMSYYPPGSLAGREAAVRAMADRVLSGDMSPRALTTWAHNTFGHDLALAEPFAQLDDVYDTLPQTDLTLEEVDADVRDAARELTGNAKRNARSDAWCSA
jgi:hypothetical protein